MTDNETQPAPSSDTPAQSASAGDRRSLLQNALGAIERLQSRVDAAEYARHEPIAIVGMACRMPGGVEDPDDFWKVLVEARDVVGEVPPDRWDVDAYYDADPSVLGKARTKSGGFLTSVDQFEPAFFGMSPREAAGVDPQQRLLLEVAWEAFEHAAVPVDQLDGSRTGVFVGITSMDYAQRVDVQDPERSDIYLATGTALNAAAGRVSFTFGLRGPCMAIDTACSSSLVAIHTACQSLRNGESELALAGGVNVILSPDPFVMISKWGMLSSDGRCKTFDESANGFVRGEGCSLLVLERLSVAKAKGRRILAVIDGSAINQDGKSSGLTVPNGLAQQEVVRQALDAARLKPLDVSYVEAHGTGTSLGDPIEVEALAAVYGENRPATEPFEIGSVKSNIGHLEAASGVSSVVKLVMALKHKQLPASLHVKQLTHAIPWDTLPVRVSTRLHDWTLPRNGRRIAGASAFGFSGMNAHVLVEEAPVQPESGSSEPRASYCFPLSARTPDALIALAARYENYLRRHPEITVADACATVSMGRSHLPLRTMLVVSDRDVLLTQLHAVATEESSAVHGQPSVSGRNRVAFLFTGQGAQYAGMGRELYETEPAFKAAFDRCAAVLNPLLGRSIHELIFSDTSPDLDQTGFTQPALYAIEVALAATWRSWGIEPSVVTGHSVGEFAAAAVAGVITVEDGARLIAARGRLMQALPGGGVMVSVQGDVNVVRAEVAKHADAVSIAANNAPDNTVIAGSREQVDAIVAQLNAAGLRTQYLVVSHAFHSPLMNPIIDEFQRIASEVTYSAPRVTWVSNLTGAVLDWNAWGTRMAEYWSSHVREPVLYERGIRAVTAMDCDVLLEIGPNPTLIGLGKQTIGESATVDWLPSLKRKLPTWQQMFDSVARLYVRGAPIRWNAVHATGVNHSVALPTYPFQRQPYLISFAPKQRTQAGPSVHELLGERLNIAGVGAQFERIINNSNPAWVADHRIASEALMPLTAYLETALAAARQLYPSLTALTDIEVGEPLPLRDGEERVLQVSVEHANPSMPSRVRVFSRSAEDSKAEWALHATATIHADADRAVVDMPAMEDVAQRLQTKRPDGDFYDAMRSRGADFGPMFSNMLQAWVGEGEAIADIRMHELVAQESSSYLVHPALLDACFHASAVAMESLPGMDADSLYLPIAVDRYEWFAPPVERMRSYARVRHPHVRGDMLIIDIRIESVDGHAVAQLDGIRCRRASREMFSRRTEAQVSSWMYDLAWKAQPIAAEPAALPGNWLMFDDGSTRGDEVAAELIARGARVLRALPNGISSAADATTDYRFDAASATDIAGVLTSASHTGALRGVVSLLPLRVPSLTDNASANGNVDRVPGAVQQFGTEAALNVIQALAATSFAVVPRMYFVTAGSQSVDFTETLRIEQAPVAGFARVVANEHPDFRITLVDLDPQGHRTDSKLLAEELLADSVEQQVAFRKGVRRVARIVHKLRNATVAIDSAPVELRITERGTLENLTIQPMQLRAPQRGEVQIRVRASGLNFRDVLSALGMYPGEIRHLGSDCAGEVIAVGEGVTRFAVGDRVAAMVEGAFASHACTRWEFVAPLPDGVSFEQGAAIPTAYLTSDITLNQIAHMKKGDRVLIHSGAGGVGMAAIALANRVGAEIFATAGSEEKRSVLKSLGVHHVLDSRSTSFADDIARITNGRGVDIVLNSLAGALLDRSFDCLADGGIFLEIGKRGVWTHDQVAALNRGIQYHIVDCNDNARETPQLVGEIFTRVLREIDAGQLQWLPWTTFRFEDAPDAFRFMAQARHIGRVVFKHDNTPVPVEHPVQSDRTYLVTGGLKGLGLQTARWLAGEGARHLLLVGRSEPDNDTRVALEQLESDGVRVRVLLADVGTKAGVAQIVEALMDGVPIGGVIHCAAVLDDGMAIKQNAERFARVMHAKSDGAWLLHHAFVEHAIVPDFFVMFSSLSALLGSAGQGNYVAANAFLDALAAYRREQGHPATSINWGAWSDVGMATRGNTVARVGSKGVAALSPAEGMQALGLVLKERFTNVGVAPVDWSALGAQFGDNIPTLLRDVVDEARRSARRTSKSTAPSAQRVDYAALDHAARSVKLTELVRRELATVLGVSSTAATIPDDHQFTSLGLDSLTSVELRNRLQQSLGKPVPATAAFEWPTISEMSVGLNGLFGAAQVTAANDETREEITL